MVEDFVSVVRGGTSESITALLSKKLPTPELMRLWGEGVEFNPDFIRRTVSAFSPAYLFLIIYSYFIILYSCQCWLQETLQNTKIFTKVPAGGLNVGKGQLHDQ